MAKGYFERLYEATPTRMWINNPSGPDCDRAIAAGAINCTTNPQYCQKLLSSDTNYIRDVIDSVLLNETTDHEKAAVRVYQVASQRILKKFMPLYEESKREYGYVTMQDDPRKDEDTAAVMEAVHRNCSLSPNYMVKIPVINGGMQAIAQCVEENIPICATEVFSIAQTIDMCEMYESAVEKSGNRPPFFITHITGIFDDYVQRFAVRTGIEIDEAVLSQAGCAIAKKEYRLLKSKGYRTVMLGGGVRNLSHFTEFVGGEVHITINWKDADALLARDGSVEPRINAETPQAVIDELLEKLEVFRQAYNENGLRREEYAGFGPVQLFRNAFLMGWYTLLAEISKRRNALAL
jgi:transaldolase